MENYIIYKWFFRKCGLYPLNPANVHRLYKMHKNFLKKHHQNLANLEPGNLDQFLTPNNFDSAENR